MDAKQLFLRQHSIVHSAEVAEDGEWSMLDSILEGLTDEQMRARPGKGANSIAWLLWHMARTEDVTMNVLIAEQPQVLDDEGWRERLNIRMDIGTSMDDDEVADFSEQADMRAIRAYRNAVGCRTREIVQNLSPEEFDQKVDPARAEALLMDGALVDGAARVARFWGGKTKGFLLAMPGTGHSFMHLAEALTVRRQLTR